MKPPFISALLGLLLFAATPAPAQVPVYETGFEADGHGLVTWGTSPADPTSIRADVSVIPLAPPDTGNALKIEVLPDPQPLRLAQKERLFHLQPEADYELRAKLRVSDLSLQKGGSFTIVVTNARWTWSSPKIALTATNPDWKTYSIRFKAPDSGKDGYRVRINILHVRAKVEIATLSVVNAD